MNEIGFIAITREAIWVMIKVGGPILMLALVIGLVISLFQALTQIQEMTLTFVPKMLAIFAALIVLLPFMLRSLTEFTLSLMDRIVAIGSSG